MKRVFIKRDNAYIQILQLQLLQKFLCARKSSINCRKKRNENFFSKTQQLVTVDLIARVFIVLHAVSNSGLFVRRSSRQRRHITLRNVRLSRSKSLANHLILLSGFLCILVQWREYFVLFANVKAKSFKPASSFKRFLRCLIFAGFHSSHARLLSRIEIECSGYLVAFARSLCVTPFRPATVRLKFISKQDRHSALVQICDFSSAKQKPGRASLETLADANISTFRFAK